MPMEFYAGVADICPRPYGFISKIFDGWSDFIEPAGGKGYAIEAVVGLEEFLAVDGLDRG